MPTRNIRRGSTILGPATPDAAPIYVDSDDNKLKMIPAGSGTTEVTIADLTSTQTMTNKTLTAPTLTTPALGAATGTSLAATGAITSSGGGIGYATGAGGTVTQGTSKSTGVTLSKLSGAITLHNESLASLAVASFVLTNTNIAAGDVLVLNHISGGTVGAYLLNAQSAAGSATINVTNITAGALGEAAVIQFAVIKAVSA
jgi:hypothetical protein